MFKQPQVLLVPGRVQRRLERFARQEYYRSRRTYTRVTVMVLGRITHYAFDAVLLSAFLAGVKRSTGLTPSFKPEAISTSKEVNSWVEKYLGVGEWVMDQSIAIMGSSSYFERKR